MMLCRKKFSLLVRPYSSSQSADATAFAGGYAELCRRNPHGLDRVLGVRPANRVENPGGLGSARQVTEIPSYGGSLSTSLGHKRTQDPMESTSRVDHRHRVVIEVGDVDGVRYRIHRHAVP